MEGLMVLLLQNKTERTVKKWGETYTACTEGGPTKGPQLTGL